MTTTRVTDRYSLDRQIGHGGSGAVWLGHDEVLGRTVALKRIGMPPGETNADVLRAEREAQLAARVSHPNVVAVFDLVETPDEHWLVMEYIAGTTLAQAIDARGPMPPDTAAPLLARVADALVAAHEAGIVHRDVKPSNILLGDDGEVKLSDFGIARGLADPSLTRTGLVTGSPAYLSPEVASGSSATPASDVWSLGATMFHALAGRPPYEVGDNVLGAMYRIVHEAPPRLSEAGWLAPLLELTMTHDPADRPTMAEVRDYLRERPSDAPDVDRTPTRETLTMPLAPPPPPPHPPPDRPTALAPSLPPELDRSERDRKVGLVVGIGGVVVVLAIIVAMLMLGGGADDEDPVAADDPASQPASPSDGGSPAPSDTGTTDEPATPTAGELEQFAESYVETASQDPDAGFARLTPDFQAQSRAGYEDFWGSVRNPKILEIAGDPESMRVTYRYTYTLEGEGRRTERVTLILVQDGDSFLIAGDS